MRLDVKPGLYALRYVGSTDVRSAPSAAVRPIEASLHAIEIVSAPGVPAGELRAPGSSVVILASASGSVEISLTAFRGSQNLDAKFSLDLLGSAEPLGVAASLDKQVGASSARGEGDTRRAEASLDIVAHVSRRGDVRADEDGWIAGPRAPSSIEAIQIQVRGPSVGVAAQFRNLESRGSWSAWSTPGAVIGIPKKACPLTGIRLKLVGPEADLYELVADGLFLGAPKITTKGGEVEFVAPGELDPLIGLRLKLVAKSASTRPQAVDKVSRVRVFR